MSDTDQRHRTTAHRLPSLAGLKKVDLDRDPRAPPERVTVPPIADQTNVPLERGTVARGHCVDVPDPDAAPIRMHASTPNGVNESTRQPMRRFMPGDTVELPASEIARLRAAGFLHDPDRVVDTVAMPLQEVQHAVGPIPEPRSAAKAS